MNNMTKFTRENMISMRQASHNVALIEKLAEMTGAARNIACNIYSIVVDYAQFGSYNSYRYQITDTKYGTDGSFVMKVVDMLKKVLPDFDVTPEAVGDGNTGVLMHSILIKW